MNSQIKKSSDDFNTQDFMTIAERKKYNAWRLRIIFLIILGYGTYYICRLNFNVIMPAYMKEFGHTKTEFGWVLMGASLVYGFAKFANGYLSDRSNARYFMSSGLFLSGLVTFFLGYSSSIYMLGVLWMINNYLQSMGWPPVARMLTHWFASKELGRKWALATASHQIGAALTVVLCGYLITTLGWRYAFFIPGIFAMVVSCILFIFLRESPKKLNFPNVEKYKGEEEPEKIVLEEDNITTREIFKIVFLNRNIWFLGLANMFVYIVKNGIVFWAPLYLIEYRGLKIHEAGWQIASYEIIGILGGYTAGWVSDKLFGGNRGLVGAIFMIILSVFLAVFYHLPTGSEYLSTLILTLIGFFISGPYVLIGVASAEFASKKAVGTANGFVSTTAYLGTGISSLCIGSLIDTQGWWAAFAFFIISGICGAFLFALTNFQKNNSS